MQTAKSVKLPQFSSLTKAW